MGTRTVSDVSVAGVRRSVLAVHRSTLRCRVRFEDLPQHASLLRPRSRSATGLSAGPPSFQRRQREEDRGPPQLVLHRPPSGCHPLSSPQHTSPTAEGRGIPVQPECSVVP